MPEVAEISENPSRPIQQFVTYRLLKTHLALNAQASAVLSKAAGITLGQWRVLAFIGAGDARTSRAIAAVSGLDPAQISRSLKTLEADGFIMAERLPEDRRTLALSLTNKGRAAFNTILPIMQARQQHLMDTLSAEERKVILSALEKLELASEEREFGP